MVSQTFIFPYSLFHRGVNLFITYLSHSCFEITNGKTILFDPFFRGNKKAPPYTGNPDIVLVTHEHRDHSDAERFNTLVVCPEPCKKKFKKTKIMKIGEKKIIEDITIEMVGASHRLSTYPTGYIVEYNKKRFYHMGDTSLDGVKPYPDIDVVFIPIGGRFTMNITDAVKALHIVNPKLAIPMHYNTFFFIRASPQKFKTKAEEQGFSVKVVAIGETADL